MMKLYDFPGAPNPRRVKIFAEEKNITLELINCDMAKREHKSPEFLKKNPSGKIPVLELDDGRCISESIPICRYLESLVPDPNLFGEDAFEISFIESRNRHIELELWTQIGTSWVNGPIVGSMGLFKQIPDAKKASDKNVVAYYERLDSEFSKRPRATFNGYRGGTSRKFSRDRVQGIHSGRRTRESDAFRQMEKRILLVCRQMRSARK